MKLLPRLLFIVPALSLSACEFQLGSDGGGGTGQLDLGVSDAVVDGAERVFVRFHGVELKPADGATETFLFETPRELDLLSLQGGERSLLLEDVTVPAGRYNWIRLLVSAQQNTLDSYVELGDGGVVSLFIPSGGESGLKLVNGFTVPVGGSIDLTIDFDLRKSVHRPPGLGDFILRPALRLVNTDTTGRIAGTVTLDSDTCLSPVVYAYSEHGVAPDDEGSAHPPLTSAPVVLDPVDGFYRYRVAYLPAGDYTVALTCEADTDDPAVDDATAFETQAAATVTAACTTVVDL